MLPDFPLDGKLERTSLNRLLPLESIINLSSITLTEFNQNTSPNDLSWRTRNLSSSRQRSNMEAERNIEILRLQGTRS
jgi:hypothetical protein